MEVLKKMKIWLCWRWKECDGRQTKVPLSVFGLTIGTSPQYAQTWVTYDEATSAAKQKGFDGVGFVVPSGYFFLDVDHREISDPFVRGILDRFATYSERSISGHGIHIYGKCDDQQLPCVKSKSNKMRLAPEYYSHNPNNNLELYFGGLTNRFAVYTGAAINDCPVNDCTAAVLMTLEHDMRRKAPLQQLCITNDSVNDVVTKLENQANSGKFMALYYAGDISAYNSHSEADCALCEMIAFAAGANPAMVDLVFRSSKLYREKWERTDYRESTIAAGIDACYGTKTFRALPKEDFPSFLKFRANGKMSIDDALLAQYVRDHLDYILIRDSGNDALRTYVYADGCYRLNGREMMLGRIKQYIADVDANLVKMSHANEALSQILTDLNYRRQDELDADESLINFANGLLKVSDKQLTLMPHSPEVLSTIQLPCNWCNHPEPTPVFDDYLMTLTNGDTALQQLLLEFIGVCLSNVKGWRIKKALFLVGEGDTGKSQLKSLVERLLGKGNFIGIDLQEIEARFGTGAIYGKRLAGSSDMSFLTIAELKTFKKLTGGDSLFAEFKGEQAFEFTYNGLLWFCMNRLPMFGGDDGRWVYNRILTVNCVNVIPPEKQNKHLLDQMYAEREGIVYKAIKALQNVIANGYSLTEPACIIDARDAYIAKNNSAISFWGECIRRLEPSEKINNHCTTGRIYRVYKAWCRDNNSGYAKNMRDFQDAIASHLGREYSALVKRVKGQSYFIDYTLNLDTKKQYLEAYGYDSVAEDM